MRKRVLFFSALLLFFTFYAFLQATCVDEKNGILLRYDESFDFPDPEEKQETAIDISVFKKDEILQVIHHVYTEIDWQTFRKSVRMEDTNFDGHKDILIYLGAFGNQGVKYE